MYGIIKALTASLLATLFVGCAVPDFKEISNDIVQASKDLKEGIEVMNRPEYTGTDSVGAVDPDDLIGTWQVLNLNKAAIEPDLDAVLTFKEDKTFEAYVIFETEGTGGNLEFDIKGTWSVDDELVSITETSSVETTGNPLTAGLEDDETDSEPDIFNVYESSPERMVLFQESDGLTNGLAQSFTRVE